MAKHIIETVQIIKRKYYVEVHDPTWGEDGVVMGELEPFAYTHLGEDIINTTTVIGDFPPAGKDESVNAAIMVFNYVTNEWDCRCGWEEDDLK